MSARCGLDVWECWLSEAFGARAMFPVEVIHVLDA